MENSMKVILMGAAVLIVIAVIGIGIYFMSQGQDMANVADKELSRTADQLANSKYSAYDGTSVSGSSVVSAVKSFRDMEGDLIIQITTGAHAATQYLSSGTVSGDTVTSVLTALTTTSADIIDLKDSTHGEYVNPSGEFSARLAYDSNGVVRAIIFTQI